MKKLKFFVIVAAAIISLSACGGGGGPGVPAGPSLDISELSSIRIDQLRFTDITDTNREKQLRASIYLRCKEDGRYLSCAGQKEGLDLVKRSGMELGLLDVPMIPVEEAGGSCLDIEVVFVKKFWNDCPSTVDINDDIVGVSAPVSLDDSGKGSLLGRKIRSIEGSNWIRLIAGGIDPLEDLEPSAPVEDGTLSLDKLYFTTPGVSGKDATFKLMVKDAADPSNLLCMATFGTADGITKEGVIYGGLGIPLLDDEGSVCKVTADNKHTKVSITLTIITDKGSTVETMSIDPELGTTLSSTVNNDGMRQKFIDDKGFVSFTPVNGM